MADLVCEAPRVHKQRQRAHYCVQLDLSGITYAVNICRACAARIRRESPYVPIRPLYTIGRGT